MGHYGTLFRNMGFMGQVENCVNEKVSSTITATSLTTFVFISSCRPGVSVSGGNATQIRMLYGFTYNKEYNIRKLHIIMVTD